MSGKCSDQSTPSYDYAREEMVQFVPRGSATVLDVGSASGRFGRALRREHPGARVWGIEPVPSGSSEGYESIVVGSYPSDMPEDSRFDCIVFNDVLEHMIDPWSVLEVTHDLLAPRGVVVASLPNVRHISILLDLVVHDEWRYTDLGILDRSHLRFYTATSMERMFTETGYAVRRLEPLHLPSVGKRGTLRRLTKRRFDRFHARQFAVVSSTMRASAP